MLITAALFGLAPALLLLGLAVIERVRSVQPVTSPGARFGPADGATVLHDALLLNADRKAVAAALIDLAVQRKVRLLVEAESASAGRSRTRAPIGMEIVDGATFTPEELGVLEALFGPDHTPGRVRRFSSDARALHRRVRRVLDEAEKRLGSAGLIDRSRRGWATFLIRVAAVLVIGVCLLLLLAAWAVSEPGGALYAVLLAGLVGAIAAIVIAPRPWRRFRPAAQPLRAHLAGMREYIALAEAEPLRFAQSADGADLRSDVSPEATAARLQRFLLNERLLPYAVLFGLERSWTAVLQTESQALWVTEGIEEAMEVAGAVIEAIELVGGVVQLVNAVGELVDATGGVVEVVGGVFEVVSS
ncbi:hypothetical protein AB0N61_01725 [Microbacterium sp. NPDC089320]|uniref:DUF2207 family protein n=1 Tax=Microbacterium sp. NPDC089320 TaxID=3155182 RepID=UPI00344600B0